jgi:alpha-galactosidase
MKSFLSVIVLILLLSKLALCQDPETYQNVNQWIESNFAEGKVPPFSFVCEGKSSDSFIRNWHYSSEKIKSTNRDIEKFAFSYSDKRSGLSVKCIVTAFKNFPAVEWVLNFSNKSNRNTSIIEKVAAVNHEFSYKNKGTFILHHAEGCNSQRSDFKPYDDELKMGKNIYLSPNGGRSSGGSMAFPFFNIESPANSGIMVAIGWTGKWYADILQNNENSVLLKAGMERMKLFLFPREEIRTPKICLLFWSNPDRMTGHNQFRRFVLAHHTRKINEKIPELPLSAALGHGGPSPCNEYTCATEKYVLSLIDRHQQFDIVPEVFWIDAGWYPNRGDWHNVGSWTVNKENFPNGLKPVSEAVHKVGAKFLLWF